MFIVGAMLLEEPVFTQLLDVWCWGWNIDR